MRHSASDHVQKRQQNRVGNYHQEPQSYENHLGQDKQSRRPGRKSKGIQEFGTIENVDQVVKNGVHCKRI